MTLPATRNGIFGWSIPMTGLPASRKGASVSIALPRDGRPVRGVVYAYAAPNDNGDLFSWAKGLGPVQRNRQPMARDAASIPETILPSQDADKNPEANARLAAPHRYRAVESIAYRLALVAAGEALAGVSTNGPVGWDYAGGHALPLGAGLDLYNREGQPIRYAADGQSNCGGRCYGGGGDRRGVGQARLVRGAPEPACRRARPRTGLPAGTAGRG